MNPGDVETVYRIEHETRKHGPYVLAQMPDRDEPGGELLRELSDQLSRAHSNPDRHPTYAVWDKDYRIACPTLPALVSWFDGWMGRLEAAGYVVRSYRATILGQDASGRQVGYDPGTAIARNSYAPTLVSERCRATCGGARG